MSDNAEKSGKKPNKKIIIYLALIAVGGLYLLFSSGGGDDQLSPEAKSQLKSDIQQLKAEHNNSFAGIEVPHADKARMVIENSDILDANHKQQMLDGVKSLEAEIQQLGYSPTRKQERTALINLIVYYGDTLAVSEWSSWSDLYRRRQTITMDDIKNAELREVSYQ